MATAGPGGWRAVCEACGQVVTESRTAAPAANSRDVEALGSLAATHHATCPKKTEAQGPISQLRIETLAQPGAVVRGRITED